MENIDERTPEYPTNGIMITDGPSILEGTHQNTADKLMRCPDTLMDGLTVARDDNLHQEKKSLTEFHLFPRFPGEIRIRVWRFAAHQPRIVEMFPVDHHTRHQSTPRGAVSCCKTPAVMYASKESRYECSKFYKRAFGIRGITNGVLNDKLTRQFYVNFGADMLMPNLKYDGGFTEESLTEALTIFGNNLDDIESLSLRMIFSGAKFENQPVLLKKFLLLFPNLRHILFLNWSLRGPGVGKPSWPVKRISDFPYHLLEKPEEKHPLLSFQTRKLVGAVRAAYENVPRACPEVEMKMAGRRWGFFSSVD